MNNKTDNVEGKQNVIDKMKNETQNYLDLLIKSNKIYDNSSEIIKTDLFTVQISSESPNRKEENIKLAIKNKLAFADFSNCIKLVKENYNLPQEVNLLVKKVEFDPITDLKRANDSSASKGVSFDFFDPSTKQKLNTSICLTAPTPINIPFKQMQRLNMEMYEKAVTVRDFLDLYNSKSPGYHTRCYKTTQFDTGADVSLNYKRTKIFQNQTVSCSDGCSYKGLDENKYVKCNCNTTVVRRCLIKAMTNHLILFLI